MNRLTRPLRWTLGEIATALAIAATAYFGTLVAAHIDDLFTQWNALELVAQEAGQ